MSVLVAGRQAEELGTKGAGGRLQTRAAGGPPRPWRLLQGLPRRPRDHSSGELAALRTGQLQRALSLLLASAFVDSFVRSSRDSGLWLQG